MAHTFYKIWIHIIWSTKNRYPFLSKEIREKIFKHILENAKVKGFNIISINGYTDHLHILISLNPKYSISEVINLIKGESSYYINSKKLTISHFTWQRGYSAFSVSESQVEKVKVYINNQEKHHKKISFVNELEKLYKLHKIEFSKRLLDVED